MICWEITDYFFIVLFCFQFFFLFFLGGERLDLWNPLSPTTPLFDSKKSEKDRWGAVAGKKREVIVGGAYLKFLILLGYWRLFFATFSYYSMLIWSCGAKGLFWPQNKIQLLKPLSFKKKWKTSGWYQGSHSKYQMWQYKLNFTFQFFVLSFIIWLV